MDPQIVEFTCKTSIYQHPDAPALAQSSALRQEMPALLTICDESSACQDLPQHKLQHSQDAAEDPT